MLVFGKFCVRTKWMTPSGANLPSPILPVFIYFCNVKVRLLLRLYE